jgi:hypothetical protein
MDSKDQSLIGAIEAIARKVSGGLPLPPQAAYSDP